MALRGVMTRLAEEEAGSDVEQRAARLLGEQALTAVQSRAVQVLTSLLGLAVHMSNETEEAPTTLRMLVMMLDKGRPLLVDGIAKVPDAVIVEFMGKLAADIASVIDAGKGGTDGSAELATAAAADSA